MRQRGKANHTHHLGQGRWQADQFGIARPGPRGMYCLPAANAAPASINLSNTGCAFEPARHHFQQKAARFRKARSRSARTTSWQPSRRIFQELLVGGSFWWPPQQPGPIPHLNSMGYSRLATLFLESFVYDTTLPAISVGVEG
jgi:hypothetical protein